MGSPDSLPRSNALTQRSSSKRFESFNFDFEKVPDLAHLPDDEIDRRMVELMDKLKIPEHARDKLRNLDIGPKIKMLEQYAIKQKSSKKQSGRRFVNI